MIRIFEEIWIILKKCGKVLRILCIEKIGRKFEEKNWGNLKEILRIIKIFNLRELFKNNNNNNFKDI